MKGDTHSAMSDAVDNAEVMLSGISLAYKESASKDAAPQASNICAHTSAVVSYT
jgi:hypothetical protein